MTQVKVSYNKNGDEKVSKAERQQKYWQAEDSKAKEEVDWEKASRMQVLSFQAGGKFTSSGLGSP